MARDGAQIVWDIYLGDKLDAGGRALLENIQRELDATAKAMEQFAKANHPWQNRTGDAERTFTVKKIDSFTIMASHGVYYGIFLEYSNGGRYGIIRETLRFGRNEIVGMLQKAWQASWRG